MKKQDLYFILAAATVIGVFVLVSVLSRTPKSLEPHAEHAGITEATPRETCLECHAPDSNIKPMPVRHPKKGKPPDKTTPCSACHKLDKLHNPNAVSLNPTRVLEGVFVWPNQRRR